MIDGSIAPRQAWFSQKGKDMANGIPAWRPAAWLTVALLAFATGPASAADLRAGEYACAGSSGILIGLGFLLNSDGSYTDLDRKNSGRVAFEGSSVKFIGGHLNGYVGNNVRGARISRSTGSVAAIIEHGGAQSGLKFIATPLMQ
jgi:hypothetical protein